MKKIRCIAVDDEPLALTILNEYASRIPHLEIIRTFTSPIEAATVIPHEKPDVLFLDIQMPEMRGLEFIKTLAYKPLIILTTAYAEHAAEGYNLDVIDYLVKPIPFERFMQAFNKIERMLAMANVQTAESQHDYLFVRSGYKSVKINLNEIMYIEGLKEYVQIHCSDRKYLKLDSLKNIEQNFPPGRFLRVHKSYIVNIDHVKAYYGDTIELGSIDIPVGRAYKEAVNALFRL